MWSVSPVRLGVPSDLNVRDLGLYPELLPLWVDPLEPHAAASKARTAMLANVVLLIRVRSYLRPDATPRSQWTDGRNISHPRQARARLTTVSQWSKLRTDVRTKVALADPRCDRAHGHGHGLW